LFSSGGILSRQVAAASIRVACRQLHSGHGRFVDQPVIFSALRVDPDAAGVTAP